MFTRPEPNSYQSCSIHHLPKALGIFRSTSIFECHSFLRRHNALNQGWHRKGWHPWFTLGEYRRSTFQELGSNLVLLQVSCWTSGINLRNHPKDLQNNLRRTWGIALAARKGCQQQGSWYVLNEGHLLLIASGTHRGNYCFACVLLKRCSIIHKRNQERLVHGGIW